MKPLLTFALIALSACAVEGTPTTTPTPDESPFVGAWSLTSVSGDPLPHTQPEPPFNPNQRVRTGAKIVRGMVGITIAQQTNALSVIQFCQEFLNGDGVTRRETVTERIFATLEGDSVRLHYIDAVKPDDFATRNGAGLEVSQQEHARSFQLSRPSPGAAVGGCP